MFLREGEVYQDLSQHVKEAAAVASTMGQVEQFFSAEEIARVAMIGTSGSYYSHFTFNSERDLARDYVGVFGSHGKPGDSDIMGYLRRDEASRLSSVMFAPLKDPERIKQRQDVIGALAGCEQLDELIRLKDESYQAAAGLFRLNQYTGNQFAEDTIINFYYRGQTSLRLHYDWEESDEDIVISISKEVKKTVADIERGLAGLDELSGELGTLQEPCLQELFGSLAEDKEVMKSTLEQYIPLYRTHERNIDTEYEGRIEGMDFFDDIADSIKKKFLNLGAVLELARLVRDEGWERATFDPSRPFGYESGWSLDRNKDKQVANDSPAELPITIFSGPNTSGKSFAMKGDFLIRVAAQSFGFAPAKNVNLPIFDDIVFIDRAVTDAQNDLSAFMREVRSWTRVLESSGERIRLYVDEGFSTTSPEDQAQLLLAMSGHILQNGGSVALATHNDLLLDMVDRVPDVGVYHLPVEVGEDGALQRSFHLQPGRGESCSDAVARARNFPENVLEVVREFLQAGRVNPVIEIGAEYPKIISYTEELREMMKLEPADLGGLFPEEAGDTVFSLYSLDPEFSPNNLLAQLLNAASNPDFNGDNDKLVTLLGKMILWQPPQTSAEVLERQKLFSELLGGDLYARLPETINKVNHLESAVSTVGAYNLAGINKELNPLLSMSADVLLENFLPYSENLGALFNAMGVFLSLQAKLFGQSPELADLMQKCQIIKELAATAGSRVRTSAKISDLTDEELEKARTIIDSEDKATILQEAAQKILHDVETLLEHLPTATAETILRYDVKTELQVLDAFKREEYTTRNKAKKKSQHETDDLMVRLDFLMGGLPHALIKLPEIIDGTSSLVQDLRATDSVYLHQVANFIEQQLLACLPVLTGQSEVARIQEDDTPQADEGIRNLNHLHKPKGPFDGFMKFLEPQVTPHQAALQRLKALALLTSAIDRQEFSRVVFNESGKVSLGNVASVFKPKDSEVANDVDLGTESIRVQLLTGPNGSGKTFYQKGAAMAVLTALATGYAPATQATMPIFDGVAYLDRVVPKQSEEHSSFSQEIEYWKELLRLMSIKKAVFIAADEAFSTTSPLYQAAFTAGVISEVLRSPHLMILATHNHDLITSFSNQSVALTAPYHFEFDLADENIKYKYILRPGHQKSHAFVVARALGLPV